MPRTRALLTRALMALSVLGGVAVAGAPAALAEETRPNLRSPFTCGQTWFSRTYPGHPQFAVDWNLPGSSNADFGQPVLAGGAGLATVEQHSGYGNMVVIDHGDGWQTLYAHLSSFDVASGQWVGTDTVIGRVGNTGRSDGSHLHQEQLHNGVRQQVVLDGVAVHASYSSRAASYESGNCAPTATVRAAAPTCGPDGSSWSNIRCGLSERRPLP